MKRSKKKARKDIISSKKVNLPDGLESIGIDTFGFTDIQNIFIPKSVTRLSASAFRNDYGKMLNIYVEADSHPKTWELKSNDERCHFIYNARRSDFPEWRSPILFQHTFK